MIRKCLIFGFVFCSVALNQLALAGTWKDSFEDDIISEWTISSGDHEREKWWVHDGEAIGEIIKRPNFLSLWVTGDVKWQNYTVSCRAQLTKVKRDSASFGLLLYLNSEKPSLYLFRIHYGFGAARILKILPPPQRPVQLGNLDLRVQVDKWYRLTAAVYKNGTLEFQIGKKLLRVVDHDIPRLENGKAGLVVGGAQARFDDVEITGANIPNGGPGKARPVEPLAKLATTWGHLKNRE